MDIDKHRNAPAVIDGKYTDHAIREFSVRTQQLRNETVRVQMDLYALSEKLKVARSKTFANEGAGRRLPLIARSALNIATIYPPGKPDFLTREQCDDVGIQMQAFAINVYGLLDNIAWVCMLEANGKLQPIDVGLFKGKMRPFLPADLVAYIDDPQFRRWFDEHGKVYRDSTAHRIAPYLPSRAYSADDSARWQDLNRRSHETLMEAAQAMTVDRGRSRRLLDAKEDLDREKELIGTNSLLMALSLTGQDASPPVYLHPQLLSDWALSNELVRVFAAALREHYHWPAPSIPEIHINDAGHTG